MAAGDPAGQLAAVAAAVFEATRSRRPVDLDAADRPRAMLLLRRSLHDRPELRLPLPGRRRRLSRPVGFRPDPVGSRLACAGIRRGSRRGISSDRFSAAGRSGTRRRRIRAVRNERCGRPRPGSGPAMTTAQSIMAGQFLTASRWRGDFDDDRICSAHGSGSTRPCRCADYSRDRDWSHQAEMRRLADQIALIERRRRRRRDLPPDRTGSDA